MGLLGVSTYLKCFCPGVSAGPTKEGVGGPAGETVPVRVAGQPAISLPTQIALYV